jgi:hypothetical protein
VAGNRSTEVIVGSAEGDLGGPFAVFARKRSYLNIVYLVLSFPLGTIYLGVIVLGLSLGLALAVIGIGLIVLLSAIMAMRGFAAVERQLGAWLLDVVIPAPDPHPDPWRHPLKSLKRLAADSYSWRIFAYCLLKLPFSLLAFAVVVSLMSLAVALALAPLFYQHAPLHILSWRITTAPEAFLCVLVGVTAAVLSFHVANALAAAWKSVAASLLPGARAVPARAAKGPIVIR